jgi:DnaK suppressor protein
MKPEQIEEVKTKIEKEIRKTKNKIEDFKEMSAPVEPENAIGRISRMEAINNKSIAESALRKAREKLQGLEYMYQRIEEKDFGVCAKCKQDIPIGRLLLMPQSRFCVNCAH